MADTGLMASCMGWSLDKVRLNGELNGKLIETFVYTQLAALVDASSGEYILSHYRDREKREVDFLVENDDAVVGIEVKAGTNIDADSFKHLKWFKANMTEGKSFYGIVLYSGEYPVPFGDGLWAIPTSALWCA